MKRIFYLLYTALIFLPANVDAQAAAAPKTYAVVIGISDYEDASIPPLQFADKDARLFAEYLKSKTGNNIPAAQIKLLVNEQATIAAISNAFDWLREMCKQDDVAYIFFSGHGDVETKTIDSLGYLLAYNTPPNNYRNNAIRIADVNSDANTLSVRKKSKVILITDACHSGKLAGDAYGGRQLAARQLRLINENEVRLASCAPDEFSAEGPQWGGGRGVFSYYLIKGLQGLADNPNDGKIELKEMEHYLDSCFANDKTLLQANHKQQPVIKGNPDFSLATVDNKMKLAVSPAPVSFSKSLQDIKPAALTPVDSLFGSLADVPIEGIINFELLNGIPPETVPEKFLKACITKYAAIDSLYNISQIEKERKVPLPAVGTLQKLIETVKRKNIAERFNTNLTGFIHTKAQQMINAYLKGDANERARREYYYTGNEKYSDFLSMHKLGFGLLTADNRLYREMEMQQAYLSGLIARLQINLVSNMDSLLKIAFQFQHKALALDEGAAYVHNELGVLFLEKNQFDSADYHFRFATAMAPTWALPWGNLIVLNLATGNLKMAASADSMAKMLQPENDVILTNEGLLMERLKNLLAAGALYRKAIDINRMHFLPYARLGFINIKTGNYALADSFLYEAGTRLNAIPVVALRNMAEAAPQYIPNIDEGRTMSQGPAGNRDRNRRMMTAPGNRDEIVNTDVAGGLHISEQFSLLNDGLQFFSTQKFEDAQKLFEKAITINNNIPLAHHYLGASLIKQSKWKEAEAPLKKAIACFKAQDTLQAILTNEIPVSSSADSNNLIKESIAGFGYNFFEDYFLLAKQYEQRGLKDTALEVYRTAAAIETQKASIQIYSKAARVIRNIKTQKHAFIKLVRLLEDMGDFFQEEKVLLNEFALMKRLIRENDKTFSFYNFMVVQSEIYNFFEKRILQFPGQAEWYRKAGLNLFQQLEPVYKNLGLKYYNELSNGFSANPYPFLEEGSSNRAEILTIPGTNDTVLIINTAINPVTRSLEYFQKTLELWGAGEKPFDVVVAIAQLNSWLGNKKEAMKWFDETLDMQPKNSTVRNNYIEYLIFIDELPGASDQLQILYDQNQATPNQQLRVADYCMLAGQYQKSDEALKKCSATNEIEHKTIMQSYATLRYLSGNTKRALQYLSDSLKANEQQDCFIMYSIARYTALSGDVKKGFVLLKKACKSGFKKYKYVLESDNAWASIVKTQEWKTLMSQTEPKSYTIKLHDSTDGFYELVAPYLY